jgi:multiple sugar transport system substrate-binding protein
MKADFTEYWEKRADEFTKLTGIKVQTETITSGDPYWAKLNSELRGRSGNVSFFVVDAGNLSLYQTAGALQSLDAYLSDPKFPDWDAKDYSPSVLDMLAQRKGQMFALPANGDVQTMYYRKDLFDAAGLKAPKTWAELYDAAKKLRKGDVWAAAWEMTGRYAAIRFGNALAPGLTWLDKDMRLSALRDPRTIEIMNIWVRLMKEELIPADTLSLDPRGVETLFATGRAAILPIAWPSQIAIFEDPTKSKVVGNVATAVVPGGEANASGMAIGVSADAKEKEAAYLFVSWLTSKETCTKNAIEYQDMGSLRASVSANPAVEQMFLKRADGKSQLACYNTKAEALKKARFAPAIAEWSGPCINAMAPIFQKIMAGATSVDKGMNEAADAAEKLLEAAGYYKK